MVTIPCFKRYNPLSTTVAADGWAVGFLDSTTHEITWYPVCLWATCEVTHDDDSKCLNEVVPMVVSEGEVVPAPSRIGYVKVRRVSPQEWETLNKDETI